MLETDATKNQASVWFHLHCHAGALLHLPSKIRSTQLEIGQNSKQSVLSSLAPELAGQEAAAAVQ